MSNLHAASGDGMSDAPIDMGRKIATAVMSMARESAGITIVDRWRETTTENLQ